MDDKIIYSELKMLLAQENIQQKPSGWLSENQTFYSAKPVSVSYNVQIQQVWQNKTLC